MLDSADLGSVGAAGAIVWGAAACVSLYILITIRGVRILFGSASLLLITVAACLQAGFIDPSTFRMSTNSSSQLLLTLSSVPMLLSVLLCAQHRWQRSVQETALANSISGVANLGARWPDAVCQQFVHEAGRRERRQ
jgi:hypothetical protein